MMEIGQTLQLSISIILNVFNAELLMDAFLKSTAKAVKTRL